MAIPSIQNNTPSAGYFSWGAFNIQLNGITYGVPAASSNQRWVWWEFKNGAPVLNAGPDVPATLTDDDLVLFANKNGIGVRVQSSNFVDGELLVDGSIFSDALSTNLINSNHIVTAGLDAGVIKFGTMSGDRIAVNTLDGKVVKAGTLLTSALLVTDMENLLDNPQARIGTIGQVAPGWTATSNGGPKIVSATLPDGSNNTVFEIAGSGSIQDSLNREIDVNPGDEFWVAGYLRRVGGVDTTGTVQLLACSTTKTDGTLDYTSPTQVSVDISTLPDGVWVPLEGSVTMPPKAAKTRFRMSVRDTVSDGTYQFWGLQVRRKNNGKIIVDGAIDTNKISTLGLDAKVIKFGTMSGERIEASSIKALQIDAEAITAVKIAAGAVQAGKIDTDAVLANNIKAGEINAQHLSADVILAKSRIAAIGSSGQSVELNPEGFFVYGPTSEGRPPYVSFPTEGGLMGKPNIISGTLQATTLSVDGNPITGQAATFRQNSQFEPGATVTLNNSILAPIGLPAAESIINEISTNTAVTGSLAGMTYHPAENAVYFLTRSGSAGAYTGRIYKITLSNNAITFLFTIKYGARSDLKPMGLTFLSNQFYVGYLDVAAESIMVARYDTTTLPGSWFQNTGVTIGYLPSIVPTFTLGNDGTNIWIGDVDPYYCPRFRRFTAALSTVVQETITTTMSLYRSTRAETQLLTLNVGNFDFGARKFILTYNEALDLGGTTTSITYDMAAFTTTGARDAASEFFLMRKSSEPGLVWKGTSNNDAAGSFVGVTFNGDVPMVNLYSKLKFTAKSIYWYIGSTYYRPDTDGAGPITEAETTLSPQVTMSMCSRWNWKVTVSAPPSGLSSRIYISQVGQDTKVTKTARLQATLANGVISISADTYNAAAALAPAASTFGATTPSLIQSQETIQQLITVSITNGSKGVLGDFQPYMVSRTITGTGIPAGTTVESVTPGVGANLSNAATATNSTLNANLTLPKLEIRGSGYARITELERVIISSTQDADPVAGNQPALRVGDIAGAHLRIDDNEIIAMSSDTTQGALFLNKGGDTIVANTASGRLKIGSGAGIPYMSNFDFGRKTTGTADSSGRIDVAHNLGTTPVTVQVTPSSNHQLRVFAISSTTFTVEAYTRAGALVSAGASPNFFWIAIA